MIAHGVSERFPLVVAANRDEDYGRPSLGAHFWPDEPGVLGGRDEVAGGTWLALTREGRFAAVTNLRGAEPGTRSRGELVRDFVTSSATVAEYAAGLAGRAAEYAGFHLIAGDAGGELLHATHEGHAQLLTPGIHALTNAPLGQVWPKSAAAAGAMRDAISGEDETGVIESLMGFLRTPRATSRVESEVFIAGERYGTRASTVIVASSDELWFVEQGFTRGGTASGDARHFRIGRAG